MLRAEPCRKTTDARPDAYFREAADAFAAADRQSPSTVRTCHLGRRSVRVEYSDPELERCMAAAFAHLPSTDEVADLRISAFESARSGVEVPASPFAVDDFHDHGELRAEGPVRAVFKLSPRALSMFDESSRHALWWTPSCGAVPNYERAAPFRTILHWWAQSVGAQLVHGAAVGTERGGVLLAGPGGAGKSTAALACLGSGLRYAGDDYVLVDAAPDPLVHSVYCTGKLTTDQLARFPHLREHGEHTMDDGGKSIVYLHEHYAHELVPTMPLVAIVVPRVTGTARPVIRVASPRECLVALAPSTMFQHTNAGRDHTFQTLASLARAVPGYHLEVGPDLAAIPPAIERILSRDAA